MANHYSPRYPSRHGPMPFPSYRPAPSFSLYQQQITGWQRSPIQDLNEPTRALLSKIDYREIGVRRPAPPTKELALADGLAYLYFLQHGSMCSATMVTRRLDVFTVTKHLANIIPASHFRAAGVPPSALSKVPSFGQTPSHKKFLIATKTYIDELVLKRFEDKTKEIQNCISFDRKPVSLTPSPTKAPAAVNIGKAERSAIESEGMQDESQTRRREPYARWNSGLTCGSRGPSKTMRCPRSRTASSCQTDCYGR